MKLTGTPTQLVDRVDVAYLNGNTEIFSILNFNALSLVDYNKEVVSFLVQNFTTNSEFKVYSFSNESINSLVATTAPNTVASMDFKYQNASKFKVELEAGERIRGCVLNWSFSTSNTPQLAVHLKDSNIHSNSIMKSTLDTAVLSNNQYASSNYVKALATQNQIGVIGSILINGYNNYYIGEPDGV